MSTEKPEKNKTAISDDGLRYKKKSSGSPFMLKGLSGNTSTMSCFLCGAHKPTEALEMRKFIGKSQKICKGGCKK